MECHNDDVKKKEEKEYDAFCTYPGMDGQISTWLNCSTLNTSFMDLVVIL